jgi:hypothetical protein
MRTLLIPIAVVAADWTFGSERPTRRRDHHGGWASRQRSCHALNADRRLCGPQTRWIDRWPGAVHPLLAHAVDHGPHRLSVWLLHRRVLKSRSRQWWRAWSSRQSFGTGSVSMPLPVSSRLTLNPLAGAQQVLIRPAPASAARGCRPGRSGRSIAAPAMRVRAR